MRGLLSVDPSGTMNAAAADGASCAADRWLKIQKNSLPAVPRRGPEAEVIRIEDNFHGSGVNRNDSFLFL